MDLIEIKEITNFSKARKNPYAERIQKHGYSITIHYSPEDVAKMTECNLDSAQKIDMLELDSDELAALMRYREANKDFN